MFTRAAKIEDIPSILNLVKPVYKRVGSWWLCYHTWVKHLRNTHVVLDSTGVVGVSVVNKRTGRIYMVVSGKPGAGSMLAQTWPERCFAFVSVRNKKAQKFYEKHNFQNCGRVLWNGKTMYIYLRCSKST